MLKFIPIKAQAGISGFESPACEHTQLAIDLDSLLIEHPSASFIGLAQGDSMMGSGIFNNDLLIVCRAASVKTGDVVICNLNGEFICKVIDKNKSCLLSTSKNYKPYFLNEGDDFQIEGVVTRSIRLHRPLNRVL
jgi:DNA polymerase V